MAGWFEGALVIAGYGLIGVGVCCATKLICALASRCADDGTDAPENPAKAETPTSDPCAADNFPSAECKAAVTDVERKTTACDTDGEHKAATEHGENHEGVVARWTVCLCGVGGERGSAAVQTRPGDSGVDVCFPQQYEVPPRALGFKLNLGTVAKLRVRGTALGFWLLPRSSLAKTPLRMSNGVGLIDPSYNGPLIAAVDNHSDAPFVCKAGESLFQIASAILPRHNEVHFVVSADELDASARGAGAFGSTGR